MSAARIGVREAPSSASRLRSLIRSPGTSSRRRIAERSRPWALSSPSKLT
jgi:hypothetical protein